MQRLVCWLNRSDNHMKVMGVTIVLAMILAFGLAAILP